MADIEKSVLGSVRLDSDIWEAVREMPCSLNQYLRTALIDGIAPAGLVGSEGFREGVAREKARQVKVSKRQKAIEMLKASDPMADQRPDVEYGSEELPSGGSVVTRYQNGEVPAGAKTLAPKLVREDVDHWRAGRKPLPKPKDRGK